MICILLSDNKSFVEKKNDDDFECYYPNNRNVLVNNSYAVSLYRENNSCLNASLCDQNIISCSVTGGLHLVAFFQ